MNFISGQSAHNVSNNFFKNYVITENYYNLFWCLFRVGREANIQ